MRTSAAMLALAVALSSCAGASGPDANDGERTTTLGRLESVSSTAVETDGPATTAAAPTTVTAPPRRAITITITGDTSFTHGLDRRDPLGGVANELRAADLAIVNLETTVAEPDVGAAIEKRFVFKSPPATAGLLHDAGVDVAALANNHALDYGPDAVVRTIELLEAAGVATAGTGASPESAYEAQTDEIAGWDIAVLSFTRVPCDAPEPGETFIDEIAWACPEFEDRTVDAVAAASAADLVIVMVHWGVQRRACPEPHQWDLAQRWIDAGADIVAGSHPHVLQGIARVDGAWVLHSTGNFAFPSARDASADSALFTFTVAEAGTTLDVTPIRIVDGRPEIARASRQRVVDTLNQRSFGFGVDAEGAVAPSDRPGECR